MQGKMFSKVKAAGVGGGITAIVATVLVMVLKSFGIEVDEGTAVALAGALITIVSVAAGWFRIERVGKY